ncbi:4923_t:CDS:2 [Racocetra fulgida]|uniref:4923_t:CDS:1 n=1 Tax=Racocetra fulgida TaxID=60492 RepID=A0A9N8Z338_9GLOM|nr:4923_t:CDS:2 [Racocetra fulgida]
MFSKYVENVDERVDNVLALEIIPLLIEFLECYHDNLLQAGSTQHTQALVAGDVTQHLIKVLTTSTNIEVQTQIIWALGNIAGDGAVFRDIILSAGVIEPLLYILTHYDKYDYMAVRITVWATANMCRGCRCSDPSWSLKQTQSVIDAGALTILTSSFLTTKNLTLRRDACLAVSNVAAGTYKQVNAVLTEPNLIESIVALLWDSDMKVVKEACWVLSNSTSPNSSQILANEYADKLASAGIVEALIMTWNNSSVNEIVKEKVRALLERWFCGYLPRNNQSSGEIEEDIASIEERVSRLTIMGGVF